MSGPIPPASGPPDPSQQRSADPLSELVRDLQSALAELDRGFARRLGMTLSELHTVSHLSDSPLGPGELAERVGLKPSAMSTLVDRLEGRGHAVRVPHTDDRRKVAVELTGSGVGTVLAVVLPMVRDLDAVAADLTPEERAGVERYLRGVLEVLRRHTRGPDDPTGQPAAD